MKFIMQFSLVLALTCLLFGCGPKEENPRPAPPPPPPYSGPDFLRTTIGSMCAVRGYQPQLVSGYGLVAGLRHTGSPDCPPQLRAWFLNELAAKGFGRESLGYGNLSPSEVLASDTTAVVFVEAIIPPGATVASRFDVIVTALPGTQTSSLEGGRLYTTDLRFYGSDVGHPASQIIAKASGDLFLNPFAPPSASTDTASTTSSGGRGNPRVARILSGGQLIVPATLALQLNQPSYLRSRQIADRINTRFPQMPGDPDPLAVAKSDQLIQLNVIGAFAHDPKRMVELVNALFLDPTDRYNHDRAVALRDVLEKKENQQYAPQISLAWQAMGRNQLPLLREMYDHKDMVVRLAALEAGARLGDARAAEPLFHIAVDEKPGYSDRAVALLGYILRQHPDDIRVTTMVRQFIDANDALIRLSAFDALANIGDPLIRVRQFPDKFELDLIPSSKPMIYVTRQNMPRIVVFNPDLAFNRPVLFASDDNSFMLRLDNADTNLNVYYRDPDQSRALTTQILPAVPNLIYLLANSPTEKNPTPGFRMTYSQVVHYLYLLSRSSAFNAPLVLEPSNLIQSIAEQRRVASAAQDRPESTPGSEPGTETIPGTDEPMPKVKPDTESPTPPSSTPDSTKPIRWRDIPSENLNSPVAPTPPPSDNPSTE